VRECTCTLVNNVIKMHGIGSDGTATGLTFACGFAVDGRDCKIYLDMPYYHSKNTVTWSCSGFTLVGQAFPSGSRIEQPMVVVKNP
jgi:hypothetical protein